MDIREIRASERRLRDSQLFEANPAQGKAPKIEPVLAGRDDQDDEDEAKKPAEDKGSRRRGGRGMGRGMGSGDTASDGGSTFRGQSPDSPSVTGSST